MPHWRHNLLIGCGDTLPVQPNDIIPVDRFRDAFKDEGGVTDDKTAYNAFFLIQFLQNRADGWKPFLFEEALGFYKLHPANHEPGKEFDLKGLLADGIVAHGSREPVRGFIALCDDGKYHMTNLFVVECFGRENGENNAKRSKKKIDHWQKQD